MPAVTSSVEASGKLPPIRTAILGYGLSGRVFHAPFLRHLPEFDIKYIVTSDKERRARAESENPSALICESVDQFVAEANMVDLVVLAGPPQTHLEQGLTCLAQGAAIVVDKPFASSVAEARELVTAAGVAGLPLIVFHNRRWDGDFLTVKSLIDKNKLGDVFHFESTFEHWSPVVTDGWKDQLAPTQGGGVGWDLGSHLVDHALQLFGPVTDVSATLSATRPGAGNDDSAVILLTHGSGVVSKLTMNRIGFQGGPRLRVLGTGGTYTSYGLDPQEPTLDAGVSPGDATYGRVPEERYGVLTAPSTHGKISETRIATQRGDYSEFYRLVAAALRRG